MQWHEDVANPAPANELPAAALVRRGAHRVAIPNAHRLLTAVPSLFTSSNNENVIEYHIVEGLVGQVTRRAPDAQPASQFGYCGLNLEFMDEELDVLADDPFSVVFEEQQPGELLARLRVLAASSRLRTDPRFVVAAANRYDFELMGATIPVLINVPLRGAGTAAAAAVGAPAQNAAAAQRHVANQSIVRAAPTAGGAALQAGGSHRGGGVRGRDGRGGVRHLEGGRACAAVGGCGGGSDARHLEGDRACEAVGGAGGGSGGSADGGDGGAGGPPAGGPPDAVSLPSSGANPTAGDYNATSEHVEYSAYVRCRGNGGKGRLPVNTQLHVSNLTTQTVDENDDKDHFRKGLGTHKQSVVHDLITISTIRLKDSDEDPDAILIGCLSTNVKNDELYCETMHKIPTAPHARLPLWGAVKKPCGQRRRILIFLLLCGGLIPRTVAATPAPTAAAVQSPSPTAVPSPSPTDVPTSSLPPTHAPSWSPSREPTPLPTFTPTPSPTLEPFPSPTLAPTLLPTVSVLPTHIPTPLPSQAPTSFPTIAPTQSPTSMPTPFPTSVPSPAPTPGCDIMVNGSWWVFDPDLSKSECKECAVCKSSSTVGCFLSSDALCGDNVDGNGACTQATGYGCLCQAGYEDEFCQNQQDPTNSMLIGSMFLVLIFFLGYLMIRSPPDEIERAAEPEEEERCAAASFKQIRRRLRSFSFVCVATSLEHLLLKDMFGIVRDMARRDKLRDLRKDKQRTEKKCREQQMAFANAYMNKVSVSINGADDQQPSCCQWLEYRLDIAGPCWIEWVRGTTRSQINPP